MVDSGQKCRQFLDASQGETMEELTINLQEAIEGGLSVEIDSPDEDPHAEILEVAV